AAHGLQFHASRELSPQRLKSDLAAPTFQQARPQRLRPVLTARSDRKRKGRPEIESIEADFAVNLLFIAERQDQMPAQVRAGRRAVQSVESQLVAGERQLRGQADILRQWIGGLESEQRREIDLADVQIDVRFGILPPWLRGPAGVRVESRSRYLRRQLQRRTPLPAHRAIEFRRSL